MHWRYVLPYVAGALASTGFASAQRVPCPVRLELKLERNSIAAGEPVVLEYRLFNSATSFASMDLGRTKTGWLHAHVEDRWGREAQAVPDRTPLSANTFVLGYGPGLGASQAVEGRLVVAKSYSVTRACAYFVTVDVNVPCRIGGEAVAPVRSSARLPLSVGVPAPAALRRTAGELADVILQRKDGDRWLAVEELMSMPEEYSLPWAWRLAATPGNARSQIVWELQRIGSQAAGRVLLAIYGAERNEENDRFQRDILELMNSTGAAVRR